MISNIGAVGLLWSFIWWLVIHPAPETHPTISEAEKSYIMDSLLHKKGEKVHIVFCFCEKFNKKDDHFSIIYEY